MCTQAYNTAIGHQASYAQVGVTGNTACGYAALKNNTTAENCAFGKGALQDQTSGVTNNAFGYQASHQNQTGRDNCAFGYYAMTGVDGNSHDYNNCFGNYTLQHITTGDNNAAFGHTALQDITTGNKNTAMGYGAGKNITTGEENLILGSGLNCGDTITTGSRNVIIGRNVDVGTASRTDSLVLAAGNALVTDLGAGTSWIGAHDGSGTSGNVYRAQNESTWDTTSDRRIKKNIVNNNNGLDLLNKIQVRNFEYRKEEEITELPSKCVVRSPGTKLGVIAQEVQGILPDIVEEGVGGCLSVKPDNITWYLVNAVKELSAEVEALKSQINN